MDIEELNDDEKQNRISVLYSLTSFADGIETYVKDQFGILHNILINQLKHINQICTRSCSKNENNLNNWCNVCSSWRTAILCRHKFRTSIARSKKFNWSYFDSSRWPTDAHEFSKCFHPDWCIEGSTQRINSSDISVLIGCMNNCLHFTHDLKPIRHIRNEVCHTDRLTLNKKTKYCQTLDGFLQIPDIWTYEEAKKASFIIKVFERNSMNEIWKRKLIEENILKHLEDKTFPKTATYMLLPVATLMVVLGYLIMAQNGGSRNQQSCDLGYGLSFEVYLQQYQSFVGRHWLYDGIRQKMEFSQGVLLIADHGYGKTAAMANLIEHEKALAYHMDIFYHICRHDVIEFQEADKFILNLVQKIYCKYPDYEKVLEKRNISLKLNKKKIEENCKFDPFHCFDELVNKPLSKLMPKMEDRIVILIDGLDECNTFGVGYSVLSLMVAYYEILPYYVKYLFTTSNDTAITSKFHKLTHWHLRQDSSNNKDDVNRYIHKKRISHLQRNLQIRSKLQWNFLLIKYFESKTKRASYSLHEIAIPSSIDIMLDRELGGTCWENDIRIILEITMASMKPLTKDELFNIISVMDYSAFDSAIQKIKPFLNTADKNTDPIFIENYMHKWLLKSQCKMDVSRGHRAIAKYFMRHLSDIRDEHKEYFFIIHLFIHIQRADEISEILDNFGAFSAIIDKPFCGEDFNQVQYQPCHTVLEVFASVVDSYKLMKKCISLSRSPNMTIAAVNAIIMGNNRSLKAILKHGTIDHSCYINFERQKSFVNFVYNVEWEDDDMIKDQFTLIHIAIIKNNFKAFKILINHTRDVWKQETQNGLTSIELSVIVDHLESFRYLEPDSSELHALLNLAAVMRAYRIFIYLLESGVDDFCRTCTSFLPNNSFRLITKSKHGRASVFDLYFNELTCESVLNYGVRVGDEMIVKNILGKNNATIECRDFQGLTPLAAAIVFNRREMFNYLISIGADTGFRCEPTNVEGKLKEMLSIQHLNNSTQHRYNIYTYLSSSNMHYCPNGSSIGYLILRWPTCICEIVRLFRDQKLNKTIWFHTDSDFKIPMHYLICRSEIYEHSGLFNSEVVKIFFFMIASLKSDFDAHMFAEAFEMCTDTQTINIRIYGFSFAKLMESEICKSPKVNFPRLENIFFKIFSMSQKSENLFFNLFHPQLNFINNSSDILSIFPILNNGIIIVEVHDVASKEGASLFNVKFQHTR